MSTGAKYPHCIRKAITDLRQFKHFGICRDFGSRVRRIPLLGFGNVNRSLDLSSIGTETSGASEHSYNPNVQILNDLRKVVGGSSAQTFSAESMKEETSICTVSLRLR